MKIQSNNKGFTLTEILIAVAILSLAVVPMLANFVSSSKVNSKSKRTMNGTIVAQNIMEGINAYGVEETIIQLENTHDPAPDLKFIPTSMNVENWGRCTFETEDVVNTQGITVKRPKYVEDTYQDNEREFLAGWTDASGSPVDKKVDFQDTIQMQSMEPGAYNCTYIQEGGVDTNDLDTRELNLSYDMKYAYKSQRVGDDKVYFINDKMKEANNYAHAYMFWLRNVQYGSKKYDVLLTMDANYYREHMTNGLRTTVDVSSVDPDGSSQGDNIRSKISNSHDSDKYGYKRTYNDVMLSRITNNTGTNASIDDTTPDRFYVDAALEEAVNEYRSIRCKGGVTREQILAALERKIDITIRRENNPADGNKPYRIITVANSFKLLDASLLNIGAEASYVPLSSPVEIFRSCEKAPRNIYIYYQSNYEAYRTATAPGQDIINITNAGGNVDAGRIYGADMNLFLVRQTNGVIYDSGTLGYDDTVLNQLEADEGKYRVQVNITEDLKDNDVKNLNTHIYTNIGYNLRTDQKITSGTAMGTYTLNRTVMSVDDVTRKLKVGGLDGINLVEGSTQRDYIYDVTVQVFEPGRNFVKEARIAKFTGSSN